MDGGFFVDAYARDDNDGHAPLVDEFAFVPPADGHFGDDSQWNAPAPHLHQQEYGHIKQEPSYDDGFAFSTAMELDNAVPSIGMVCGSSPVGSSSPQLQAHCLPLKYEAMPNFAPLPTMAVPVADITTHALVNNAHVATRGHSKNSTPQPPVARTIKATIKREPLSPCSVASTAISSPPMPALIGDSIVLNFGTSGVRSCSSAGSNSGGSGVVSDCSMSDSDSDSFDGTKRGKGTKKGAKAGRKRKSKNSGSASSSEVEANGDENDLVDAVGMPLVGDKRAQRLQRNRASAQLSRERKKQYMKLLEKQLKEMAELNTDLATQVTALTGENTQLKARLAKLAMRERVQARFPRHSSNASQASTTMPSLSHSPLASVAGSDGDSAFSAPATPSDFLGLDDDSTRIEYPAAKKLRVAAYANPSGSPQSPSPRSGNSSSSSNVSNVKAGLLLFTLVMSVGLFSTMIGLDTGMGADLALRRSGTPAVIEPLEEVVPSSPVRELVTLPTRGRVLSSLPEHEDEDAFALVPVDTTPKTTSSATDMDVDSKALDVYTDRVVLPTTPASTHAQLDLSSAHASAMLRSLFRGAAGGNLTHDADASYIFAPSALRITRSLWHGMMNANGSETGNEAADATPSEHMDQQEEDEKQVALFDRSRRGVKRRVDSSKKSSQSRLRHRLPSPAALAVPEGSFDFGGSQSSLAVGDKLYLWVPLHTVAPGSAMHNDSDASAKGGLVEIACQIAHVRPLVLA